MIGSDTRAFLYFYGNRFLRCLEAKLILLIPGKKDYQNT
jgi:hypothetical protein